ncbi:MAG: FtsX-like permease family protein [Lachnospiraceae bacterium]|nr:FtsX-like permease family protein [Lachnospiraceae bacterium]
MKIWKDMKSCLLFYLKWGGRMKKALIIAHSNFRKSKGQMISIAALMLIVGMMLNLWLILQLDYAKNFERQHDRLNAGHVMLAVNAGSMEAFEKMHGLLTDIVENDERTDEFSIDEALLMPCKFAYNGGEMNANFAFLDKDTAISRSVGRIEIVEDSDEKSGIYMPMIYKSEDIAIGKQIKITLGTNDVYYTVCGFTNSVMAGSHNCSLCEIILTDDKYKEARETIYADNSMFVGNAILCSVRLKNKEDCKDYHAMIKDKLSSGDLYLASNHYEMVFQSRYVSQMICSAIISAMAFLILLIALVVMASNIANYIQENMKILGVLKAIGYTSNQVINSFHMQFLGVSLIAAMLGAALSYCIFPVVNEMMISQTGIPYTLHFLAAPFFITVGILSGAVFITVWAAVSRIKKIEPIVALRQGVKTHSFKRNYIPLEHTKAPLDAALALKTMFTSVKNNITICISMLVVTLVLVFSAVMAENVIWDMNKFTAFVTGESCDSCINVNSGIEQDFLNMIKKDERVEKVYLFSGMNVTHVGGMELLATLIDDYEDVNNPDAVFKGRFPKYDNEIAIGVKYAREQDINIGDEIAITANGTEAKFIVSGFTQIANNLGLDCILTREGYRRLGDISNVSYYINLVDGADIDAFNMHIEERFGNEVNITVNVEETLRAAGSVYVQLMVMIVIGVLILSAGVIAFVLYLLVRTRLGNKKRDYGIMKSLGFTTGQLIFQTAFSFMPPVILSTIVGLFISCIIINPFIASFLSNVGIVKCTFTVPLGMVMIEGVGLIVFTFLILCLMSLKIKKLSPYAILVGE